MLFGTALALPDPPGARLHSSANGAAYPSQGQPLWNWLFGMKMACRSMAEAHVEKPRSSALNDHPGH